MTNTITNASGTINPIIIDWKEEQVWDVAIRDVQTRSSGQVMDTGTKVVNPKEINIAIRITDAEKTTLQSIADAHTTITLTVPHWSYTTWLVTKNIKYKYIKSDGTEKPWETTLRFIAISGGYTG